MLSLLMLPSVAELWGHCLMKLQSITRGGASIWLNCCLRMIVALANEVKPPARLKAPIPSSIPAVATNIRSRQLRHEVS